MVIKNKQFNFPQIQRFDKENWVHPWQNMVESHDPQRPIIQSAKGIYLYDDNGHELIDAQGGMWCMQIGYGRQEMVEAIAEQALKLPYMSPFSSTSEPSACLAKKLSIISPGDLTHIFFTTGGSTAVDIALRFVSFYNNIKERPYKNQILACSHSYHGSTYLSASVSSRDENDDNLHPKSSNVHFLSLVDSVMYKESGTIEDYCAKKVEDFEKKILEVGASRISAFIAEPIQASGGIIIPPPNYLAQCKELCKKYDIIYISDEVVTGFGRLGHWFASKPVFELEPDIVVCAKGLSSGYLPIGAVMLSEKLIDGLKKSHMKDLTLALGFTYSGHPVCCAAALKNIEIIEREGILEHVQNISIYFQSKLQKLKEHCVVINVSGMGLLASIRCKYPSSRQKDTEYFVKLISEKCKETGVFVRYSSNKLILSPPLVITSNEVDLLVHRLSLGIELAFDEMRKHHV